MSTETKDRTDEKVVTYNQDGDHDRFQHYFHKKAIEENFLTGKPMTALCGRVVERQADPEGRTVCETCKEVLDTMFPQ